MAPQRRKIVQSLIFKVCRRWLTARYPSSPVVACPPERYLTPFITVTKNGANQCRWPTQMEWYTTEWVQGNCWIFSWPLSILFGFITVIFPPFHSFIYQHLLWCFFSCPNQSKIDKCQCFAVAVMVLCCQPTHTLARLASIKTKEHLVKGGQGMRWICFVPPDFCLAYDCPRLVPKAYVGVKWNDRREIDKPLRGSHILTFCIDCRLSWGRVPS